MTAPDLQDELDAIQNRLDEVALKYLVDNVPPIKQEEDCHESGL